jgi:hypothetical protein
MIRTVENVCYDLCYDTTTAAQQQMEQLQQETEMFAGPVTEQDEEIGSLKRK